jgi:hypothetical protein
MQTLALALALALSLLIEIINCTIACFGKDGL